MLENNKVDMFYKQTYWAFNKHFMVTADDKLGMNISSTLAALYSDVYLRERIIYYIGLTTEQWRLTRQCGYIGGVYSAW